MPRIALLCIGVQRRWKSSCAIMIRSITVKRRFRSVINKIKAHCWHELGDKVDGYPSTRVKWGALRKPCSPNAELMDLYYRIFPMDRVRVDGSRQRLPTFRYKRARKGSFPCEKSEGPSNLQYPGHISLPLETLGLRLHTDHCMLNPACKMLEKLMRSRLLLK